MAYSSFKEFTAYKKALAALIKMYEVTKRYPSDERFVLISDTRRSANSICHNTAEGFGRFRPKDKMRFYTYASSSGYEILSQLEVAKALEYLQLIDYNNLSKEYEEIIEELERMIKAQEKRIQ